MVTGKVAELFEGGDIIRKTITGKLTLKTTYSTVNTFGESQLVPVILLNSAKLTRTM